MPNIKNTDFEFQYEYSLASFKFGFGIVSHFINAKNEIIFGRHEITTLYTTNIRDSSNEPSLVFIPVAYGCDDAFDLISTELPEEIFENIPIETRENVLKEISSIYKEIKSMDDLEALHSAIIKNTPSIGDFLDPEIFTDDPSDYEAIEPDYESNLIPKRLSESGITPGEWITKEAQPLD